ncbi:DUF2855 family protein [Mycolicibacterium sp. GCM10028919]|uniref:DUF2855 family protein n=1 Tax=Mycolicibacterium sp. GCM10028919 TaxID=3273401 RepID=UPI00360A6BAE
MNEPDDSASLVLEVDRNSPLDGFELVHEALPPRQPGLVTLAVERFSVAANNLGYVLVNDVLKTLEAFPSPSAPRARIPVWGIAEVVAADPTVAAVGTRVAGFLPMATRVAVRAESTDIGLLSVDDGRVDMLPIYRRLVPLPDDSESAGSDVETVLMPVHPFAALLANDVIGSGVRSVVITSASSRSASALARLLVNAGVVVVGLTSAAHRSAAETFGVYDRVLGYDEVDRLDPSDGTTYVDVAGSSDVTGAVHDRLGRHLVVSIGVGGTHARSSPTGSGPPLAMFNTGDREVELTRERGWPAVQSLYDAARSELVPWASEWLRVRTVTGLGSTEPVWRDIVAGRSDPLSAVVIRP